MGSNRTVGIFNFVRPNIFPKSKNIENHVYITVGVQTIGNLMKTPCAVGLGNLHMAFYLKNVMKTSSAVADGPTQLQDQTAGPVGGMQPADP